MKFTSINAPRVVIKEVDKGAKNKVHTPRFRKVAQPFITFTVFLGYDSVTFKAKTTRFSPVKKIPFTPATSAIRIDRKVRLAI